MQRAWEPMEGPDVAGTCVPSGFFRQDHLFSDLSPHPSLSYLHPLSYAPNPWCLSGLCFGEPLQIPSLALSLASCLIGPGSPAQQPVQPGSSPAPFLPTPHAYQPPFHLAFAQGIPCAYSTLSKAPLSSFTIRPGPGLVPPPSSLL